MITNMKIKDGYVLRRIADENIVVAAGERVKEFGGMMTLNSISAILWEFLQQDRTFDDLLVYILSIYDIDEDTAEGDIKKLLTQMESIGVLEP